MSVQKVKAGGQTWSDSCPSCPAPLTFLLTALTLAWSPEGGSLAVATLDGAVVLWDAPTLTQLGSVEGRQDL